MPGAQVSATRVDPGQAGVTVGQAFAGWAAAMIAGIILGAAVIGATGHKSAADGPVWVTIVSAFVLWLPMVAMLWGLSNRFARGSLSVDYGFRFATLDLLGVPIGVLAQLVAIRLLYWPLEHAWPGTFGRARVERNARDLYDQAHGGWLVGLVAIVVIGAPLVEELVYRGLLQGALVRRINDAVAVVAIAALFALVHFRWVEYPGLFLFGLILGTCTIRTRRLGMGILAHMAFNATGLLLVAWA
jgi:uncharacterized protein